MVFKKVEFNKIIVFTADGNSLIRAGEDFLKFKNFCEENKKTMKDFRGISTNGLVVLSIINKDNKKFIESFAEEFGYEIKYVNGFRLERGPMVENIFKQYFVKG